MIRQAVFLLLTAFLLIISQVHSHPFLWKASGEHTFYLFGTIHLPDPRVTDLPPEVISALSESDHFYAELDLKESNLMQIAEATRLDGDQTLTEILPPLLQDELNDLLEAIHPAFNISNYDRLKIWVIAVSLLVIEQQQKFTAQPPLDLALFERATALGLKTGGVESNRDQFQIFDDLTQDEQIKFLSDTVGYIQAAKAANKDIIEESIQAYLHGDLEKLTDQLLAHMKDDPFYEKLLKRIIDDRNDKMTRSIQSLLQENSKDIFFFAIGAGHFAGKTSIKVQLEKAGYHFELVD